MINKKFHMSFENVCSYVKETKKKVFTTLHNGEEITLDWCEDEDDSEASEVWATCLKILDEYSIEEGFYSLEELKKEFPDIEKKIWNEGVGPLFANEYGERS